MTENYMTGDRLIEQLSALANPHRVRIIATLTQGEQYVSELARELQLSRPMLHLHLKKLHAAGLVDSSLSTSEDGKAMRFYRLAPFSLPLTPQYLADAAETLSDAHTTRKEGEQP